MIPPEIKRLVLCNIVLVVYFTSMDFLDFLLRLLMLNILYCKLFPQTPSIILGWEKHVCQWLSTSFNRVSSNLLCLPATQLVILLVLLKIFAYLTLWIPNWFFILVVGQLIACYPLVEPLLRNVKTKVGHLQTKLDGAVEKLYNLIPRYNMHRMG